MKKILTLMAAMSAASGAFAYDYDWAVPNPSNIKTDDAGNVEGCKDLMYDATSNVLSFYAEENDQIMVSVQNLGGELGTVSANGTSIEVGGNKEAVLNYTADANGLVKIVISGNLVVTKINVTSKMYLDLVKEYNDAKAALNDVNKKLAGYSTKEDGKFLDFFNAFMKEVNKQGQAIEKAKADLEDAKKANNVSAQKADISKRLSDATTNVTQIPTDVQKAENQYKAIVGADAKASDARIKKAKKTSGIDATLWNNGGINNLLDYMWDFKEKVDGTKVTYVKDKLKAAWETSEIASIEEDRNKILADALDELKNYPKQYTAEGKTKADFQKAYADIVTSVDNMIARAIVERDYKAQIEQIAKDAEDLDKVIAANPDVFKTDALSKDYNTWKKDIKDINEFINKTDNRQDFTKAELDVDPVKKYTDAAATLEAYKTDLVKQAQTVLNKLVGDTQKDLNDYMYKVVAKYENEPKTQEEWQKKFAAEQDKLNKAENTVKGGDYTKLVVNYATIKEEINTVRTTVNGYWGQTLDAQKGEVVKINNKNAQKLYTLIDNVRDDYNDRIQHIQKWLGMQFMGGEESTATIDIKKNLQKLFDIVLDLDNTKKAIGEDVAAINKLVDATSDAEFDPNNDKYRFFDDKAKNSEDILYTKVIGDLKTSIETEIKAATFTANKKAAEYLNNDEWYATYAYLNVAKAKTYVDYAKSEVDKGYKDSKMSSAAATSYTQAFDDVATARFDAGKQITLGYIDNARTEIAKRWCANRADLDLKKHTLADDIEDVIQKEYLNKVQAAVEEIQIELDSYKVQYATIGEMKVKWNFAKANEKKLQEDAKAVDKTIASDFISNKIEAMNKSIDTASQELEKKALNATEQKSATDATEKQFNEDYKLVTEFKTVTENNAAKKAADKKVEEIKNSIKAAQTTLNGYRDEVKAEYTAKLSDIEGRLTAQESNITSSFEAYTLGTDYEANIKGALENIDADIKQLLADAKNEQEGGNLDENGDGVVDIKDVNVVADKAAEGTVDTDTYYNFIDAYLKYTSKK
ncbi:hypothetical protein [Prevotella sp.]|uniref:hypothetical protein n=1 Tax=Prevotella sp. TaxID=59823 RepID=UPI0027E33D9C|nr:hypothetical protein [Prevotella sp.]